MNKILRIALTEFGNSLRSKAFIIGAAAVPVIYGLAYLTLRFADDQKDTSAKTFAVVDGTGQMFAGILTAAENRPDDLPRFIPEEAERIADQEELLLGLSDRVRAGELFAFAIIDPDLLDPSATSATLDYYSATPTNKALPDWIKWAVGKEVRRIRLAGEGYDIDEVERLTERPRFRGMELVEVSEDGEVELGKEDSDVRLFIIPFVMVMMMFVMVMTAAPALLTTALEEKTNKVFEFLVSAVTPFQLMMGKLLGAIGTALALAVIYVGGATAIAAHFGVLGMIQPSLYLWFFFFLVLSVMIFGSACVAIGSVCSEIRDAQSMMLPVTMLMVIPIVLVQPVLQAPDGGFARAVTFFPPATPVMLLLRNAVPPGLPWWELALGVVVSIAFMVFMVWAAAKVFRIGVLSQGQTPTFARLLKWVFSK